MEVINGYKLVSDWTTAGGGMGKWAFAEKNGKEYFIKQFLRPTFPLPEGPGSPETKARKRAACESFESHHKALSASLSGLAGSGGHLIVTREFFRVGAKYYKVTDRVETSSLKVKDVAKIDPARNKVILALTIAHSLEILHRQGIVHGDLKPANILIKLASRDVFVAKLIDFDDSYRFGNPPKAEEIVGDPTYYSPELLIFIQGEGHPSTLGGPSDIFALGIVLCQYFSGALPIVDPVPGPGGSAPSIAEAALEGLSVRTGLESTWPDMNSLLTSMMARRPTERPTVTEAVAELKRLRDLETRGERTRLPAGADAPLPAAFGLSKSTVEPALRGKGLKISDGSIRSIETPGRISSREQTPLLRGKLAKPPATES